VSSAGTFALRGRPAAELAVEVAAERGVDLCRHSTCHITPQLLDAADLVLCVEKDHMVEADVVRKDTCGKYRMLSDFGPRHMRGHDIEDPYGAPRDCFVATYETIETCVEGLCNYLLREWG
jgi:protein-tyrosine phosphatase